MYVSKHHALPEPGEAQALIEAHPLGAWVVPGAEGLVANHVPLLLDRSRGPFGTLMSHVSCANPVWKQLPWKVTEAPADFIGKLLRAVVSMEIPIERLVRKLKASQDEALQDRLGTASGLAAEGTENAAAMALLVERAAQRLR